MTAPSDYLTPWRLRPDRIHLYAPDRDDWPNIKPPPPPPLTPQVVIPNMYGTAVWTTSTGTRDDLIVGVDMPTRATTGVTDTSLITESTTYTYNGVGTAAAPIIVENKWFTERVFVNGSYYLFRNCWFSGSAVTVGSLVQCTNVNSVGNVLQDCTFNPQNPQWDTPAIKGWQFTLIRPYVRGCTDGIAHIGYGWKTTSGVTSLSSTGDYSTVDQNIFCYGGLFELGCYLSPDQGAAGGLTDNASHLDICAQLRGGRNIIFKGNLIQAFLDLTIGQGGVASRNMPSGTHLIGEKYGSPYATSCFMLSPVLGSFDGLRIEQNWMNGGAVVVNFAGHITAGTALGGIQVLGNRVGLHHRAGARFWWLAQASLPISLAGNVEYTFPAGGQVTWTLPAGTVNAGGTVTTTPANTRSAG